MKKQVFNYNQGFGKEATNVSVAVAPNKNIYERNLSFLKKQKVVNFNTYKSIKQQLELSR